MIRLILTDVDGVLTNGKVTINEEMKTSKDLCFKDLDALTDLKKEGYKIGIITGEKNFFTEFLLEKLQPEYFFDNCKDKKAAILKAAMDEKISLKEVCYIGDGKYDIEAMAVAGIGVCPADAIIEVKDVADKVLSRNGGEGCMAELVSYLHLIDANMKEEALAGIEVKYIIRKHRELVDKVLSDEELLRCMRSAVILIVEALKSSHQILFCGNGGSAADAQHLATELVSRFYMERQGLNAESLTTNGSSLTAIGNDYSFERIFARQVEAKGNAGDVLIGITTSGKSPNIIEALKAARIKGMKTLVFTGENTQEVKKLADIIISIPSVNTPRIQEMHIMVGHIICEYIEKMLFV